jgi:hypothetical protein
MQKTLQKILSERKASNNIVIDVNETAKSAVLNFYVEVIGFRKLAFRIWLYKAIIYLAHKLTGIKSNIWISEC